MANKLDPHHLVALMCHVFDKQQDGSSCSLDITSIDPQYGITNKRETTIRTFPILDALASLSVSKADSQVVAISLQVNPGERQIRLMVAENRKVDHSVVPHLKSVWRILQALSTEFEAEGGSDVYEQGSPSIPKGVVLRLRIRLFREIYQHSLAKQMKLEGKWWSLLFDFVKELFIRRGKFLKGVEYGLYQAVTGLDSVLQLARKLRDRQKLTDDEWKMLYHESMFANNKARLVLAEQGDRSCEALAHEFNGTPLLTPIMSHMQKYLDHPQTYSLGSKKLGNVEIKSQKHGCSIGSSTLNPPIKASEARSPFPDFFYSTSSCPSTLYDIQPSVEKIGKRRLGLRGFDWRVHCARAN